jgi:multiple sugar transport system substrate-binding protein
MARPLLNRLVPLMALFVIAVISVHCDDGDGSSESETVGLEAPRATTEPRVQTTITFSFWGDPWEVDVTERVIAVFEADHPDIQVETVHRPWDTYFDEMERWREEQELPDVMFLEFIPLYAARGLLENLGPYIESDRYDLEDFYPSLIETSAYEGSVYGLARDNDTKVIYYNKTLFDEAGLPYPASGWTWEDLRQAAIKLTKSDGGEIIQYGFAYEPNDWWRLWVWQAGGEVYDDDLSPTRTLMDSPEAVEAIQWLADLNNVDKVTPPYEVQQTSLGIGRLFQEGKLAMAFGNHALLPGFAGTPGLRFDVVGLPQYKRRVNVAGGAGYAIASQSQHKEAAWTFLKWLESPKGQAIFTETGVAVPARRSVGQADVFLKQEPPHDAAVFLEETELGRPNPSFEGVQEATRLFDEAFVSVWNGEKTAREAIEEVAPLVDNLLSEK